MPRSMQRTAITVLSAAIGAAAVSLVACSGDDTPFESGPPDSGGQLDAFIPPDIGAITLPDVSVEPDPDAGFRTPSTLQQGIEKIGGVNMYTHVRGTLTSTMPPVIFLNTGPFLGNEYLIEPMEFLLGPSPTAPDRLHIYFDMRGTGQSGLTSLSTTTVDLDSHIDDLAAVMDWADGWLGAATAYDIVGHGYGAGIATLYAAERPDRFSRLVLVTPHPADVDQWAQWNANWRAELNATDVQALQDITRWDYCLQSIERCSLDYFDVVGPNWMCDENFDLYDEQMTVEHVDMRLFWDRGLISRDLRERQFDWREDFRRVSHPTTIIAGACDPIPAEAAEAYRDNMSDARLLILDDAGHFPFVESPARFQSIVKQALTY